MPTYTNKLNLSKPNPGQCNWDTDWYRNADILDTVAAQQLNDDHVVSGGIMQEPVGLVINVGSTRCTVGGTFYLVPSADVNLTGATTTLELLNYIFVNSSGALSVSTTPPTGNFALVGIADTSPAAVVRYADIRNLKELAGALHVVHEEIVGTPGGASVQGTNIRALNNTLKNTIGGASVVANEITLPPGEYHVTCSCSGETSVLKTELFGLVGTSSPGSGTLNGFISLDVETSSNVVTYQAAAEGEGLGVAVWYGPFERYVDVVITRVD